MIRLLIFLSLLFSSSSVSNTDGKFIISYVEHESIIKYYVPLLDMAYRSIGITPEFVMINDKRALKLLNSGDIDADTAKSDEMLSTYPKILKIPTPISKIQVYLVCQEKLLCNLSVLNDPSYILGAIGAKEFYSNLLKGTQINIVEVNSFNVLLQLFEQKKVDFVFMVFDDYSEKTKQNYENKYLIEEKIGYHLIQEKHQDLIPELELAIKMTLEKGEFTKRVVKPFADN